MKKLRALLSEFKPIPKIEDDETTETASSNDDDVKVTKVINWNELKKALPKYKKSNLITFFRNVEIFCITEELDIDNYWYKILVKTIPWDEGACKLVEEKDELALLGWKEGKTRVVNLIDPDFLLEWNTKLFSMSVNDETLEKYFIRFKGFVELNSDYDDDRMLAQIFIHSLPEFMQNEIRKLASAGGKPIIIDNIEMANDYLIVMFGSKYKTKIFNQAVKEKKTSFVTSEEQKKEIEVKKERLPFEEYIKTVVCYKCKELGHFGRNCRTVARLDFCMDSPSLSPFSEPYKMNIAVNGKTLTGFIDSGASHSVIDEELFTKEFGEFKNHEIVRANLADGSMISGFVSSVDIEINNRKCKHNFIVTKLGNDKVIIGRDLFLLIDFTKILKNEFFTQEREDITKLVEENIKETNSFPAEIAPLQIRMIDEKLCWTKQYRNIPECHQKSMDETITDWKNQGIIEKSADERYNSSIITAPKKSNGIITKDTRRVCIDLSRINDDYNRGGD